MSLPTLEEINPIPEDLDGQCAVRNFLGKNREQITKEFEEHGLSYQEDLMFMGNCAFCFYFPAAVDYVLASWPGTDGDVVNCLLGVVEHRLEYDKHEIQSTLPEIVRFADHLLGHYADLELEPEIYGDLRPRLLVIREICVEQESPPNH